MKKTLPLIIICLFLLAGCNSLSSLFRPTLPENAIMTADINNNWIQHYYIDEYGVETNTAYIETNFAGIFSNSATQGSECSGTILVNAKKEVQIFIYEYNQYTASGFGTDDVYNLTIWDANSDEVLVKDKAWHGDDRFYPQNSRDIIDAIATHESVRVRLSGGKYSTSTYTFYFETSGFAPKYLQIVE